LSADEDVYVGEDRNSVRTGAARNRAAPGDYGEGA